MPFPTTAITATPDREATPSMRPAWISSRNALWSAATARLASPSARVKPIELSEEAWKIVETDSPSACTAAKVRAAMPGTPIIPRPATVTRACPRTVATAFTGNPASVRRADTSVPGRSGCTNDRTTSLAFVPSRGMRARGWRTLAPKYATSAASRCWSCGTRRASGTAFGSAVRIPATSFQRTALEAPRTRTSSVAVRSEPPRPSVATLPSGASSDEAGHDGRDATFQQIEQLRPSAARVPSMSGVAPPW